jgi:hypothetical protein
MTDSPAATTVRAPERWQPAELRLIAIAAVATVLLHVALSTFKGLWIDEYATLHAVMLPWREMLRERLASGHSPLYFIYARPFLWLGFNPVALRLSSALAAGAALLPLAWLARALGLRAQLPTFLLLGALFPYWIEAGTLYRYQMPMLAVGCLVLWLIVRPQATANLGGKCLLLLGVLLLTAIHHTAHIFCLGLWVYAALEARAATHGRLKNFLKTLWPVVLGQLLSLPLILLTTGHAAELRHESSGFSEMFKLLLQTVYGNYDLWPTWAAFNHDLWLGLLVIALLAGIALGTWRLKTLHAHKAMRLLLAITGTYALMALLILPTLTDIKFYERYLVCFSIPMLLLTGLALAPGPPPATKPIRLLQRALQACIALALLLQATAVLINPGDGHRELVTWVVNHISPEDALLAGRPIPNSLALAMQGYSQSLPDLPIRPRNMARFRQHIRAALGNRRRGFALNYTAPAPITRQLPDMKREGLILDYRVWSISTSVEVGAFITQESERGWLMNLPAPHIMLYRIRETPNP